MKRFCYALTAIAISLYVAAIFFSGSSMGEILSDAGNAFFLLNIVIILNVLWAKFENNKDQANSSS